MKVGTFDMLPNAAAWNVKAKVMWTKGHLELMEDTKREFLLKNNKLHPKDKEVKAHPLT
jgi:hypothetical protein